MYRAAFAASLCLLNLMHRFRMLGAIACGQTWTKARWGRVREIPVWNSVLLLVVLSLTQMVGAAAQQPRHSLAPSVPAAQHTSCLGPPPSIRTLAATCAQIAASTTLRLGPPQGPAEASASAVGGAGKGALVGLGVGLAAGLIAALVFGPGCEEGHAGCTAGLVVGGAALGAGIGAIVGALTGKD